MQNDMVKRLAWSGLLAGIGALSTIAAQKIATAIWVRLFERRPDPTSHGHQTRSGQETQDMPAVEDQVRQSPLVRTRGVRAPSREIRFRS